MRLLLVIAVSVAGIACRATSKQADPNRPLVYWPPPNRFDIELTRILVKRWNAEHPKIQVEIQPLPAGRSSEEVLLASIVGKSTPDICSNILTGTVERMVRAGALFPLSRFDDFARYVNDRSPPGTLARYRSADGKGYQLPWKANPQMLMVNTRMLARHKIAPADLNTYSGFLAAARKLKRDTDGDGRVDQWALGLSIDNTWWKRFEDVYPLFIAASGGKTLIGPKRVKLGDKEMVEVFNFLRRFFAEGLAPRSYFARQLFLQSKVAMVSGSGPSIPDIEVKKPAGFRYDFVPMPRPDGRSGPRYTFGDIKSMVVFSSCKRPKDAWRFIKYLTSARADLMLMQKASQLPLRKSLLSTEPFATHLRDHPKQARLARAVDHVRGTDDTVHLVEIFDTLSQAYEGGVIYGIRSPEAAVQKAAKRVVRILEMWN